MQSEKCLSQVVVLKWQPTEATAAHKGAPGPGSLESLEWEVAVRLRGPLSLQHMHAYEVHTLADEHQNFEKGEQLRFG